MLQRFKKAARALLESNGHAEEVPIALPTKEMDRRKNQLLIGLPCGWNLMCVDLFQYAIFLVNELQSPEWTKRWGTWKTHVYDPEQHGVKNYHLFKAQNSRIEMCRNAMADSLLRDGYSHLLMIDPDMSMDDYRDYPWWQPFFTSAMEFLTDHPCSILGAPYAGWMPDHVVHVFGEDSRTGDPKRIPWEKAQELLGTGWQQVKAIGTGLMLCDRAVFEKMEPPFFYDQYYDAKTRTKLRFTQDAYFCMKAEKFGIKTYVNWNSPCAHWQHGKVHFPGLTPQKKEWQSHVKDDSSGATDPVAPVLQAPVCPQAPQDMAQQSPEGRGTGRQEVGCSLQAPQTV